MNEDMVEEFEYDLEGLEPTEAELEYLEYVKPQPADNTHRVLTQEERGIPRSVWHGTKLA